VATFLSVVFSSLAMAACLAMLALIHQDTADGFRLMVTGAIGFFAAYSCIGLPAHALLRRLGHQSLAAYAITGGFVGLLLVPLVQVLDTDGPHDSAALYLALRLCVISAVAASVFCIVRNHIFGGRTSSRA
jgi:hypothetical protein